MGEKRLRRTARFLLCSAHGAVAGAPQRGGHMTYVNDNRLRAEFFGTLCLILIGCAAIVLSNFPASLPLGFLPIAMTFGMTVAAMAYAVGPISGCHLNPAVTAAMWS